MRACRPSPATLIAGACALALAGCASTPPDEDPVQIKLKDLDTRVERIERIVSNQSLLDLSNQLESLRSDVRGVHNDVDELSHSLEAARKEQRDLYADLERRVKALEARPGSGGAAGAGAATGAGGVTAAPTSAAAGAAAGEPTGAAVNGASGDVPVPGGSDTANYQAAFQLLKDSQYDRAIIAFQQFLKAFPESPYADNAQYWLGEAYYVQKSFPEALAAFQRVVGNYPQSRKVPDALLKVGFCDYELKQWSSAHDVLTQVVTNYPDTPASNLARQRLDKMAAEKH